MATYGYDAKLDDTHRRYFLMGVGMAYFCCLSGLVKRVA